MSGITRSWRAGLVCASVVAVVAMLLANSAGGASSGSANPALADLTVIHTSLAHSAAGIAYAYVYGSVRVEAKKFNGAVIRCPRRFSRPIGGFFDSRSAMVLLTASRPNPFAKSAGAATGWAVVVTNLGTSPETATVGAVCAK